MTMAMTTAMIVVTLLVTTHTTPLAEAPSDTVAPGGTVKDLEHVLSRHGRLGAGSCVLSLIFAEAETATVAVGGRKRRGLAIEPVIEPVRGRDGADSSKDAFSGGTGFAAAAN